MEKPCVMAVLAGFSAGVTPAGVHFLVALLRLHHRFGLARRAEHAEEAGGDAEAEEHEQKEGAGPELEIEPVADTEADGDRHGHLDAKRRELEDRPCPPGPRGRGGLLGLVLSSIHRGRLEEEHLRFCRDAQGRYHGQERGSIAKRARLSSARAATWSISASEWASETNMASN